MSTSIKKCPICNKTDKLIAFVDGEGNRKVVCDRCHLEIDYHIWQNNKTNNMINSQKKYIRNTHTSSGEFRKEMSVLWDKIPSEFRGLVHVLSPERPMNIYEIMQEIYIYASQYPIENDARFFSLEVTQATLDLLVNFYMVKVVES